MNRVRARGPLRLTFGRCLRAAALPTFAAALVGVLLARWFATPLPGLDEAPGARTPWLHLPLLVAAAVCAARALSFWPLMAARRPGRDQVARLQRGPLRGCGAALAGALLAQGVLTLPLTTGFAWLLGAPATATVRFAPPAPREPLLDAERPRLVFAIGGRVLDEVQLRPLAAPPVGPWQATRVRVLADGEPVAGGEVAFAETRERRHVRLPPRAVDELALEYVAGTIPLVFPSGALLAVEAGPRSGLGNGIAAAVAWLVPGFTALAFALLFGSAAALPTVLCAVFVLLFVQTVGGVGPADDALLALLRGDWVLAPGTFSRWFPSLAAGSVAMIGAMLLRRGHAR